MFLSELFVQKNAVVSFEIFPPKTTSSIDGIYETIDALAPLRPDFISVTYGAGGSTKDKTVEIASLIKNKYNVDSLAHLTCLTAGKKDIRDILNRLQENGVKNILALRGDYPKDGTGAIEDRDFRYASDLVHYLKTNYSFCVGGACYPEGHPECASLDQDIENLKRKVDAGVDFLITQLFYDNETFFRFKEKVIKAGIKVPIQAGIMPITNRQQVERIIELTNAKIPPRLYRILDKFEGNKEAVKDAGLAFATEQIVELLANDVDGVHIYTMNRPQVAKTLIWNLESLIYAINS
ncbi:MAG: methylenetetrahydrofolate reductase [NAD(P)H] [Desulfitobacteriia bacterium]|jgi:methylenetetrahydrofolate reductase (NADPH)